MPNTSPSSSLPVPIKTFEDTGLSLVFMRDLLLKTMFRTNIEHISALENTLRLPARVLQQLVDICRESGLIEALGNLQAGNHGSELAYRLSDTGKSRALDALSQSEYYGPMPVPMNAYNQQVKAQSISNLKMTRKAIEHATRHLILPKELINHLGPAAGSGKSVLLYGPPGNGKSSIAHAIRDIFEDTIYVPYAIEYAGQIITVFDPIVHEIAEENNTDTTRLRRRTTAHDQRYALCKRPAVVTGGELTLDMLDLRFNATARTYTAPLQLKCSGGVFIIDDLGRQAESPKALINRWIIPLENGIDILSLQTGEKFEVPFDNLVLFSTNYHPNKIFDAAALRRVTYKIKIDGPDQDDFLKIFMMVARHKNLPMDQSSIVYIFRKKYPEIDNVFASYQPGFLIDQIISICEFEEIPLQMTPELIDRAWANMFVEDEEILH